MYRFIFSLFPLSIHVQGSLPCDAALPMRQIGRRVSEQGNRVIVIGASAGGVEALTFLFDQMPSRLPAPMFVVQHLAPWHRSHLTEILSKDGHEARNPLMEEPIQQGIIYVAPPNCHMLLEDGKVKAVPGPKENRQRPAINVLFRSAAQEFGPRVIGVVLSGTLDDGTCGIWDIKRRGGIAIVQDPADAAHPQMPRSVIENVNVDYVRPLAEIPQLLTSLCSVEVPQ